MEAGSLRAVAPASGECLGGTGALGVAFVSLLDNLDLTTHAGRLVFQVLGAMAELERALIQERVKARLRNARAKGKRLGRPRVFVSESKVESIRASGASWWCGASVPFVGDSQFQPRSAVEAVHKRNSAIP